MVDDSQNWPYFNRIVRVFALNKLRSTIDIVKTNHDAEKFNIIVKGWGNITKYKSNLVMVAMFHNNRSS